MDNLIIEAGELQQSLADYRIIDCRFSLVDTSLGYRQYKDGHIPGAVYFDLDKHLSGEKKTTGGRHPLPDLTSFSQMLADVGISKSTPVVVYDNNKLAYACRVWWLLKSLGLDNVRILNGGYDAWLLIDPEQQLSVPPFVPKDSSIVPLSWKLPTHSYNEIKEAIDQQAISLVDSREEPRYRGEQEPIDPVAGHIPGAINKPWTEVTDGRGFIKKQRFHQDRWADITPDKPLVIYCGSGVTATVNILSAYLAGREASLYVGSWSDWCSHPEAEVVIE